MYKKLCSVAKSALFIIDVFVHFALCTAKYKIHILFTSKLIEVYAGAPFFYRCAVMIDFSLFYIESLRFS